MNDLILIGDPAYSSWSLRGWLLFDAFGLEVTLQRAPLYSEDFPRALAPFAPARQVPAARLGGDLVWDSLALAEELATRHPEAGHWPAAPAARALARSMAAEMHAGFSALRTHCAMNLRRAYSDCFAPPEVLADIARIETLWSTARAASGSGSDTAPWLFGRYSAADVFFAPVAARIAGHALAVGEEARRYVSAHLAHPSFRRWRAMGLSEGPDLAEYDRDWPRAEWPRA